MLFKSLISSALLTLASIKSVKADLPAIEVIGNKFYFSNNGSQFYIRGIAYQADVSNSTDSSFSDPLADAEACARDIPYLQELYTNVVRVYAVNASLDHTECMEALDEAGIYVIADLAEPTLAIDTSDPSWDVELYNRYTEVIDMFSNYTNVLGFFAGNEVITNTSTSDAAPYVKAAIRDMKQYISDQGYRDIPIGYSANDDSDTRVFSADYFACGSDDVKADFYGINMYEWCGSSTFSTSGYEARTEEFSNLTIPVFFSEYGCNAVQPRKFTEVAELYSDDMTDVWSGGIVYMYFQETNDYGLVTIKDDGDVSTLTDFNYLKSELASISPTSASTDDITVNTATTFSCPATNVDWEANTSLPPTPDESLCDCVDDSAACVVSSDVSEDEYADLFAYICGVISCDDVTSNGTSGVYGAYSFCNAKAQLNYMLNKYYEEEGSSDDACSFDGSASLRSDAKTAKSCSTLFSGVTETASEDDSTATETADSKSDSTSKTKATSSSSSSSSSASSIYSKKYVSSLSELSMTLLLSTSLLFGICVIAL